MSAARCILTVSDTLVAEDEAVGADYMSLDELEAATRRMIEIALEAGTSRQLIPIGLNLTSIGVSSAWWLESARQRRAGRFRRAVVLGPFRVAWAQDDPVLECWTTLTAAAAATARSAWAAS